MNDDPSLNWKSDRATQVDGLRVREFEAIREGRRVPAALWHAAQAGPARRPLVMIQHGGSGHKLDMAVLEVVVPLVCGSGFLAVSIDGPIHGTRADPGFDLDSIGKDAMRERFLAYWKANPHIDDMVGDWQLVLNTLSRLEHVDSSRVGWWGVSMGTAYGLPFIARCKTIRAAVLGKWAGDYVNSARLVQDAPAIGCSVLFVQCWDDELFSRHGVLDLFDRLGTEDKRLHVYPGSHFARNEELLAAGIRHLRTLADTTPSP